MGSIVTKEEFKTHIRPLLKKENQTIALCHGVFDLVHPGHITHFEQAKEMADVLVVSITAEQFVRKGPDRPYFNDEQRMRFLSSIECIDYVMRSDGYTVNDIIESVAPDFYVKGQEYADENADLTENIKKERELVERHGGSVRYTTGAVFSSTKLINKGFFALPEDVVSYMKGFNKKHSIEEIQAYADEIRKLKVLVIGDTIIDKYTYCMVQGLMSKDTAYSARELKTEDYPGGAAAVARHLSDFCGNVTFLSVIGKEPGIESLLRENGLDRVKLSLVQSDVFPTIVKHRYLSPHGKRSEYNKVFVSNNIPQDPKVDEAAERKCRELLQAEIEAYDAVFVCDFGHGLMQRGLIKLIQERAKLLILNCQTNSSNVGMNNITKYQRADIYTLDQKELKLAVPAIAGNEERALKKLSARLGTKSCCLTRGSLGAIGYSGGQHSIEYCPAFTLTVADTIGAGDAFYCLFGCFAAVNAPLEVATVMGNIGGALGVNIVGNRKAIERADALKFASTLMNV